MKIISLGYRCSSAGILKYLNIKEESYPFDWIISRLPIIKHCIENKFVDFLKKENYEKRETKTIHYSSSKNLLICNENILYNTYYQEKFSNDELLLPYHLQTPQDTYGHYLALNHHNILHDKDYDYYKRCIERFNNLICSIEQKKYLYIHPVICIEEYNLKKEKILNEFISFQKFMCSLNTASPFYGIFIIIVRTNFDEPITNHLQTNVENIDINLEFGYSIHVVYTHKEFIDAGEIFYQDNNHLETRTLIELVKTYIK